MVNAKHDQISYGAADVPKCFMRMYRGDTNHHSTEHICVFHIQFGKGAKNKSGLCYTHKIYKRFAYQQQRQLADASMHFE